MAGQGIFGESIYGVYVGFGGSFGDDDPAVAADPSAVVPGALAPAPAALLLCDIMPGVPGSTHLRKPTTPLQISPHPQRRFVYPSRTP